ncbi:MAG: hypothetical protein Q4D85_06570 [Corynebacterium sp.]|uniref:hypothetical protein n=1 Tax=Corynebacterium sp. TaxID=1720 RepID=UPI0026DAA328|nr:hypothetical protein [Corynebacterium sp.]MDO5098409.1 hypothetical protein [Corynebacterium sp.]
MEQLQSLVGKTFDNVAIPGYMENNYFHPAPFALWILTFDGPTIRLDWGQADIQYSEVSTISYEFDVDDVGCSFADVFAIELGDIEDVEIAENNAELKIRTNKGVFAVDAWNLEGFHYYFVPCE